MTRRSVARGSSGQSGGESADSTGSTQPSASLDSVPVPFPFGSRSSHSVLRALTIAVVLLVVSSTVAVGVLAGAGTGLVSSASGDDESGVAAAQPEVPDPSEEGDDDDADESDTADPDDDAEDEDSAADDESDEADDESDEEEEEEAEADDGEDEDDNDITTIDLNDEDEDTDDEEEADGADEDVDDESEEEDADDDGPSSPGLGPDVRDEDEDDDDSGGIISDRLPSWDPASWGEGTLEYLLDVAAAAYVFLIDDVANELLGTPRPVNDGASGVFGYPVEDSDGPSSVAYSQLFHEFFIPNVMPLVGGIIGFVLLGTLLGPPLAVLGRGSARSVFVGVLTLAFALIVYWDFISFLHHMSHWVTQWFLPEGEEIVEDAVDGAAGPLGAIAAMSIFGATKGVILVLMQATRWALLMVAPFALPFLLVGAYAGYFSTVKMISSFFIWQYYGLLVMNWPTAFLLRIAATVDFEGTFDLPAESAADEALAETVAAVLTLAVTMGIWIAALAIPFLIAGSFGLASILGRGMFAAKLGSGVARLRQNYSPFSKNGPGSRSRMTYHGSPLTRATGRNRGGSGKRTESGAPSSYGSTGSLASPAARANMVDARADGGWTSRKQANGTGSDGGSSSGGLLSRSGGSSRRRGGRGRGRNRSRRDLEKLENITGSADTGTSESRRAAIDERRRAASEKTRAQNQNQSQPPSARRRRQSHYGASNPD
jgi:hypothetical protein